MFPTVTTIFPSNVAATASASEVPLYATVNTTGTLPGVELAFAGIVPDKLVEVDV